MRMDEIWNVPPEDDFFGMKVGRYEDADAWLQYGLQLARAASMKSKDPSTKVGAVIFDSEDRVVSTGYNGFPRRYDAFQEDGVDRDFRLALTLHAEENAILFARCDLKHAKMFVYPFPSCSKCMRLIAQAGIDTVVVGLDTGWEDRMGRWKEEMQLSFYIAGTCGVEVIGVLMDGMDN